MMTGSSNARMKERTVRLLKFAGPLMGGCTVQYVSSGFSPLWADTGSLDPPLSLLAARQFADSNVRLASLIDIRQFYHSGMGRR